MLYIYSLYTERVYVWVYEFSVTAITGFKQPSRNGYQKTLVNVSRVPKSLSSQRSSRAPFGAPPWGRKARRGRITLGFASPNTLVVIGVYPEPKHGSTTKSALPSKRESVNRRYFQGYLKDRGNKKPSPLLSETTVLAPPSRAQQSRSMYKRVLHFCKCF